MAKVLRCKDVGATDCNWEGRAETTEELMRKAAQHGKEAHGMETIPPDLAAKVQDAIRDE
jgi:predicted small metal-binding protein